MTKYQTTIYENKSKENIDYDQNRVGWIIVGWGMAMVTYSLIKLWEIIMRIGR